MTEPERKRAVSRSLRRSITKCDAGPEPEPELAT